MAFSDNLLKINQLIDQNKLEELNFLINTIITANINCKDKFIDIGIRLAIEEKFDIALLIFKKLNNYFRDDDRIPYNIGLIHAIRNNHKEALKFFNEALRIKPYEPASLINKLATLNELKEFKLSTELFEQHQKLISNFSEAWLNNGVALSNTNQFQNAIQSYDIAIKLNHRYQEAYYNKGLALYKNRKLIAALDSFKNALVINENYTEACLSLGNIYFDLKDFEQAINYFKKCIYLKPDYAEAWLNLGNIYHELKDYQQAIFNYKTAKELNPNLNWIDGILLHTKMQICDWQNFSSDLNNIIKKIKDRKKTIMPFSLLLLLDCPKIHKIASQIYSRDVSDKRISKHITNITLNKKIKIAYFSSDFHNHATSYLISELIELHDKSKFEVIAFSFGPVTHDEMQLRLLKAFTRFIDITNLSDNEIYNITDELNIDIAIDLKGYTQNSRPSIFSRRIAPIHINYLGYPGTLGSKNYDYIIADNYLISDKDKKFYSEKIIFLPNSYQPNDRKKNISKKKYTRDDFNLPENKFIYCCFNNCNKITPEIFTSWANILVQTNDSILWLLRDNYLSEVNLKKYASFLGLDSSRLFFSDPLPLDLHLKRHFLADVFLDTFPYNAHTTASDALWAGLPLVTLKGKSFQSRVASSLLKAAGLDCLITYSLVDYENLAINLYNNPSLLVEIKNKLRLNINNYPIFNTGLYVNNLEYIYKEIYSNLLNNRYNSLFN